jgi:UDP-N-acetylglucosamine pyrophosphorylase
MADILNWMKKNNVDFVMEVTDKTRSDIKGGTLIEYEGKAKLFEIAQCPPSKVSFILNTHTSFGSSANYSQKMFKCVVTKCMQLISTSPINLFGKEN